MLSPVAIGNDYSREVDFAYKIGISYHAVDDSLVRLRKETGKHGGKDHQSIRCASFGGKFCDTAKNNGKDNHCKKWPDYRPQNPDGLLVADRYVTPGQNYKKVPDIARDHPIVFLTSPARELGLILEVVLQIFHSCVSTLDVGQA